MSQLVKVSCMSAETVGAVFQFIPNFLACPLTFSGYHILFAVKVRQSQRITC